MKKRIVLVGAHCMSQIRDFIEVELCAVLIT